MLKPRESLLKIPISLSWLKFMMAILKKKNSKYLLAVVINENSAPMVYMEPSTGDYFAIGRVFVSDTDLAKYMDHIRSTNKYSQSSIKMYILNIKEFFRVCKATHNTTKSKGHVKYIMCKIHDEELLELGTIWDSRPN